MRKPKLVLRSQLSRSRNVLDCGLKEAAQGELLMVRLSLYD